MENKKGFCAKCGKKLIVPTWKNCNECDHKERKTKLIEEEIVIEVPPILEIKKSRIIQYYEGTIRRIPSRVPYDASIYVVDDLGRIIGWSFSLLN